MLPSLEDISARRAPVGVYGLGFVGLHLAAALAVSYRVIGYDPDVSRRDALLAGVDVAGVFSRERLAASGIDFATQPGALADCRILVIAAPVPVGSGGKPDLGPIRAAASDLGAVLRPGTLILVESPAPASLVAPECAAALAASSGLAHGVDFHIACSLGGIRADNPVYRVADPLRCVVGDATATALFARAFLAPCVDSLVVPASAQVGASLRRESPPPPVREIAVGAAAALQLLTVPWMFGGQSLAAQWVALALAGTAFLCLLIPDTGRSVRERSVAVAKTLGGSAPFRLGLALAALFACQSLNPRLAVEFDGAAWVLMPADPVAMLPAGVAAPFDLATAPGGMNAARTLLIFAAPWLLFLALHLGVRSRRVMLAVWSSAAVCAAAVSVFAIGSRLSGATWLFGRPTAGVASPLGPFLYQNQGGVFLYLGFFLCLGLALRLRSRSEGRVAMSGPSGIALAAAAVVLVGALMSNSFGTAAVLAVSPVVLIPAFWFAYARSRNRSIESVRGAGPALFAGSALLALLLTVLVVNADFSGLVDKVRVKLELARTATLDDRAALRAATRLMYGDADPVFGAGAGAYRWLAPTYFEKIPAFCDADGRLNTFAYYAHCDWLQMLAEWGLFGVGAVVALVVWLFVRIRAGLRSAVAAWPLLLGLVCVALHAGWDYLIFNPAIASLVGALAFLLLASTRMREKSSDRAGGEV